MNLIDVTRTFQTDDDCLAYLETMRWPNGITCPTCGSEHISKVTRKSNTRTRTRVRKDGSTYTQTGEVRTRIYQCLEACTMNSKGKMVNAQFSATNGTIFNDSHLPLTKWFMALALIVDAKKSISAKQLQQHLGIGSYRTAWYMAHRIRKSMVDSDPTPMVGTVEIDETYIGGKAIRRFGRRGEVAPKEMVLAMRERGTKEKPGRVRYFHVPDGKRKTLEPIIKANLQEFPHRVITDSSSVYEILFKSEYPKAHRMVNHSTQWVVPGSSIHTNTVESSFSLLKRGIIGSFHRVSVKHLHRYLTEFEYRFNARKATDRFSMTLADMMKTAAMPYAALTAGE